MIRKIVTRNLLRMARQAPPKSAKNLVTVLLAALNPAFLFFQRVLTLWHVHSRRARRLSEEPVLQGTWVQWLHTVLRYNSSLHCPGWSSIHPKHRVLLVLKAPRILAKSPHRWVISCLWSMSYVLLLQVRAILIQFSSFSNSILFYWNLGNRWIQPLWTVLPYKTPPLDLSELEHGRIKYPQVRHELIQYHDTESQGSTLQPQEYVEMQKRESEI